ncbi:Uncharacterized protein PBTT_01354 [Plasmodiophora brassicae]|uniref:Uncharacterized protein n=1 Tax=Plasmodiophora brassicae TaxID=37360 RepID=A0A0G4IZ41_PLABS|nr:hypothetical protein PBRA_001438 [Plasmodiophora brassicae]SPQ94106.1 unnamed protein product [Plasmodiophora brassicae]
MSSKTIRERHRQHHPRPRSDDTPPPLMTTSTGTDGESETASYPNWEMLPDAPFNGSGKLMTRHQYHRRRKRKFKSSSQCDTELNPFNVQEIGSMTAYAVQSGPPAHNADDEINAMDVL